MNKSTNILLRNVSIMVGILILLIGLIFLSRDIGPPKHKVVKPIDITINK